MSHPVSFNPNKVKIWTTVAVFIAANFLLLSSALRAFAVVILRKVGKTVRISMQKLTFKL